MQNYIEKEDGTNSKYRPLYFCIPFSGFDIDIRRLAGPFQAIRPIADNAYRLRPRLSITDAFQLVKSPLMIWFLASVTSLR